MKISTESKILGCRYAHGTNSFDVDKIFKDAESAILGKIKSVKVLAALPNDLRRAIDNAYLRSKIFTFAPLMLRKILNNKSLQKEGERIYGYLYRATGKCHSQRKRELWTYIFDGGSFMSRLLDISLKYYYRRMFDNKNDLEFEEILKKFPELGPKPGLYSQNWTVNYMVKVAVKDFMHKRFDELYGSRVVNFIPGNQKKCKERKQSVLDRFVLGNSDFMYDHRIPCHCGKGSAVPWHVLQYCERYRDWKQAIKVAVARNEPNDGWMLTKQNDSRVTNLLWAMVRFIGHAKIR